MGMIAKDNPLWDSNTAMEDKLDWLVGELTIEEKLDMLASGSKGVERILSMRKGSVIYQKERGML